MMTAYKAIREVLHNLGVYHKDEELLESREEMICYEAQQVEERIWAYEERLDELKAATAALIDAVERYVEPKPGDAHVLRSELLNIKNEVKRILK